MRPSTFELERWNTSASFAASPFSVFCTTGLNSPNAPPGWNNGGAEALGEFTKRLALGARPGRGHAIEIVRWNEMRMHGVGRRLRQGQLTDFSVAERSLPLLNLVEML